MRKFAAAACGFATEHLVTVNTKRERERDREHRKKNYIATMIIITPTKILDSSVYE